MTNELSLSQRLAHPLPDIRRRALHSLKTKLQHALLSASALPPALMEGLVRCCELAGGDDGEPSQVSLALDVLGTVARAGSAAAASLLHAGAAEVLVGLQRTPGCSFAGEALLAELLYARGLVSQPAAVLDAASVQLPAHTGANSAAQQSQQHRMQTASPAQSIVAAPPEWPATDSGQQSGTPGWQQRYYPPARLPSNTASPPELTSPHEFSLPSPGMSPGALAATGAPADLVRRAAAATLPAPARLLPAATSMQLLAQLGSRLHRVELGEEDAQQLFEVVLQMQPGCDEGAALLGLAQLRYGVLADLPPAAVAAQPGLVDGLLQLVLSYSPHVRRQALRCLGALMAALAALPPACQAGPGSLDDRVVALGLLAHQVVQQCLSVLKDREVTHLALPLARQLVPLLASPSALLEEEWGHLALPMFKCYRPLLAVLAEALGESMSQVATAAGVVPPASWDSTTFHAACLDVQACQMLELALDVLRPVPRDLLDEVVPSSLSGMLAALALSPLTPHIAPAIATALPPLVAVLRPDAVQLLECTRQMQDRKTEFLGAVRQLADAADSSPAVFAACCWEVQERLPALDLLLYSEALEAPTAVESILVSLLQGAGAPPPPPSVALLAALMQHAAREVRFKAFAFLVHNVGHPAALEYLLQPAVAAAIVLVGLQSPDLQADAAAMLSMLLRERSAACAGTYAPWEAWLAACGSRGEMGSAAAAASMLQLIAVGKTSAWEQLCPTLMELFSKDAHVAAAAATTLLSTLVCLQLPAAAYMQRATLPFDGMLLPAAGGSVVSLAQSNKAASLFKPADVEGLLHVVCSEGMPAELAAQALEQLAHLSWDERFHALLLTDEVLAALLRLVHTPAESGGPQHDVSQLALRCLVQLALDAPLTVNWLLSAADVQLLPLLPLVFHPLPGMRLAMAQLLFLVLFRSASLRATAALGLSASSNSFAVAEPFAHLHSFPWPTSILRLELAGPSSERAGSTDQLVQRIWRAQHLAAVTEPDQEASQCSQLRLEQWEADFVAVRAASLKAVDMGHQAGLALEQLQNAQSHQACHAALARLEVLRGSEKGICAVALAGWRDATSFLLSTAPLSPDDCLLWTELLCLLRTVVESEAASVDDLLFLCDRVAAGSGWKWAAGRRGASPLSCADELAAQATLQPELLRTVGNLVAHGMLRCGSPIQAELLEEAQVGRWLAMLAEEQGSYGSRLAALRLLAQLTAATRQAGVAAAHSASLAACLRPLLRTCLMPKDMWAPERWCGKAAALAAGRAVGAILAATPCAAWAPVVVDVGSTFWLSRLTRDACCAEVREVSFSILAGLASAPPTLALLRESWPECGAAAARAAMKVDEVPCVRAAALLVTAAALASEPASHGDAPSGEPASARPQRRRHTLAPEYVLGNAALQASLQALLESPTAPPSLGAGAATCVLQIALLDAEAAGALCSRGALEHLAFLPVTLDGGCRAPGSWPPAAQASELLQAQHAAVAAAQLLTTLLQLAPARLAELDKEALLRGLVQTFGLSCQLSLAALPPQACEEVCSLRSHSRSALAPLLDAAALLVQDGGLSAEQLSTSCQLPGDLALAGEVVAAWQAHGCGSQLAASCCRLLSVLLCSRENARALLGDEESCAAAPAGKLVLLLIDLFVSSCAAGAEGGSSDETDGLAALRGLLAYSPAAKAAAVSVGFHTSLLQACAAMAAPLAASAPKPGGSKLERLKKQRQAGAKPAPERSGSRAKAAVHVAFGSRAPDPNNCRPPSSTGLGSTLRHTSSEPASAPADESSITCAPADSNSTCATDLSLDGAASCASAAAQQQRRPQEPSVDGSAGWPGGWLLVCLDLLAHLALESSTACAALAGAGLIECVAKGPLWEAVDTHPAVLALLRNVVAQSRLARHALASTGDPPLLERLVALVLQPGTVPAVHQQAVLLLSTFAATEDGAAAVLRTPVLQCALRALQECTASRAWRCSEGILSMLAALASQPEGQKALIRASSGTPVVTMLEVLLGLMQQPTVPPGVAAAAALTLRNAVLHADAKPHVLAHTGALRALVDAVAAAEQHPETAAHAAGALLALVHQGERVKAGLRRTCGDLCGALEAARACSAAPPQLGTACTSLQQLLDV